MATRRSTEDVSIRLDDGVKPFLYGVRTLVSAFLASCTKLLSSNEADEGTNGCCDSAHEGNDRIVSGLLESVSPTANAAKTTAMPTITNQKTNQSRRT